MKKRAIFLLQLLVGMFLSCTPTMSHYDVEYEEGCDEGYEKGYEKGHDEGYEAGHAEGYEEGYEVGHVEGYEEGYSDGINHDGTIYRDSELPYDF